MKRAQTFLAGAVVMLSLLGFAQAARRQIADHRLGLSRTSVYTEPDPIVAEIAGAEPGENRRLARAFVGAPPMIPHGVADHLPIRVGQNACLDCHHDPDAIGKPVAEGDAPPAPESHYRDIRDGVDKRSHVDGARYICTQCHAAQTDARPLVANDPSRIH